MLTASKKVVDKMRLYIDSEEIEDEELLIEIDEAYAMEIEDTIYYNAVEVSDEEYSKGGIEE